ncbi:MULTISPECIES: hypothetical protein [unclassified Modestobacter]
MTVVALVLTVWTFIRVGKIQHAKRETADKAKSIRAVELLEQATTLLTATRADLAAKATRQSSQEKRRDAARGLDRLADALGKVAVALQSNSQGAPRGRGRQHDTVIAQVLAQLDRQASDDSIAKLLANYSIGRQLALEASRALTSGPLDDGVETRIAALRLKIDEMQQATHDLVEAHKIHELEESAR